LLASGNTSAALGLASALSSTLNSVQRGGRNDTGQNGTDHDQEQQEKEQAVIYDLIGADVHLLLIF
jgi:hypothetical protein